MIILLNKIQLLLIKLQILLIIEKDIIKIGDKIRWKDWNLWELSLMLYREVNN